MKKDDSKALPITLQGEEIISTKKLPSVDDFSEIFDMGISVQYSDDISGTQTLARRGFLAQKLGV
ncbi:hypothetical protein PRIP_15297 [Listeria riparia FSL S10-1204]|uniref:Uncharacterized protein n=1 Tax=Listeria riparia FSL S10-1204 TaxID=1265816 RepID=W7D0V5_9LIST|nr:hypothetical protein PRIP_15297 [Listeria riparia FSL S10-1204]